METILPSRRTTFRHVLAVVLSLITMIGLWHGAQSAQGADDPLKPGVVAPSFKLPASGGKTIQLSQFKGKNLIIVFYPMDNTPGCTVQLCNLRDEYKAFIAAKTAIVGVNPADQKSHESFIEKHHYPFPLLVDAERSMAAAYHAAGPMGWNKRTVYIVDKNGIIQFGKRGTPSNAELMSVIKKLNAAS